MTFQSHLNNAVQSRVFRCLAGMAMVLLVSAAVRSEGALGNVTSLAVDGNRIEIASGTDELDVQICSSNIVRLAFRPGGSGDAPTDIIGTTNWTYAGAVIDTNSDPVVITTPAMRVEIARTPCRVLVAETNGTPVVWEPAAEGIFADGIRLAHAAGTDFYGIHGFDNNEDSSAGILRSAGGWAEAGIQGDCGAPLIWNRNGFGLLLDSDGIQFNASGSTLEAEFCSRTEVEAYLLIGSPQAIQSAVAQVSGRPPMFPKWGMGFANTEWGIDQAEFTNIIHGYRSRSIPIDLFILDFDWKDWGADHYGEWVWNPTKFPDGASGMLDAAMDAQGIRMGGIMKPRVHLNTVQGDYATSNGFWWPGQVPYNDYFSGLPVQDVNYSNAACRTWYFEHITNAYDTGIIAWWNDEADEEAGGGAPFGNYQFLNMQKAMYEGQRGHTDRRVWSINRNFWPGAQRYAYAMWSGDIYGGFTAMANQRERMLSAINLGEARWGMDIGGFNDANLTTSECYARWMQFGAVVPIYRVHGQQNEQRQPWVYGSNAEAVATAAIQLRYRLIPYIYSYDRRLHETGVGIVQPLAMAFPDDPVTVNTNDSWMFGEYLLASPVVEEGQTQKNIYLPAGTWRDFFKGTVHSGGQTISYALNSSTWEDLPLFARDGAIIPMQPVLNHVGEFPVTNLDLLLLPSTGTTSFVYYDDDGETYGYETGAYYRQEITLTGDGNAIQANFAAPSGSYDPEVEYFYAFVSGLTNNGATLNGAALPLAASEAALRASPTSGWAHATNQFGYAALAKIPAGSAQLLALSNNLAATPVFSPAAGAYSNLVLVEISCATPGAEIRYTLDGTDPDGSSILYTGAVPVAATTEVRAKAFATGRDPSLVAAAVYTIEINLLANPGFETAAGTNLNGALYWEAGSPDTHGQRWGSAARVAWRPLEGTWHGAICGAWSNGLDYGGFWQEAAAQPGQEYTFGAWFWADDTWSASVQRIKLEFLNGTTGGVTVLKTATNLLSGIGESWSYKEVSATAPTNATWVRAVIEADGAGSSGALQFDDLALEGPGSVVFSVVSAHGSPVPAAGSHVVTAGAVLTNSVDSPVTNGMTEYVCTGWTLAGNEPAGGATNLFTATITNSAQLTWNWTTNSLVPSAIEFAAAGSSADEGAGSAWILLQRDTTNAAASVRVTTSNQTAAAGSDYTALSTVVNFAAGVATTAVELVLLDDYLDESDETLALQLSEPGGAGVMGPQSNSVFTILDNDEPQPDRTLEVISAHGLCDPPAGSNVYPHGTPVSCTATGTVTMGTTQLVCAGWAGTGSVPDSGGGNTVPAFPLTNDSAITWSWTTNVWLGVATTTGGSVTGAVSGWQGLDGNVMLTASASNGYVFAGWGGDIAAGQVMENPLTLTLDRARSVTGRFVAEHGGNRLNNPGFEDAGPANNKAEYWEDGEPDIHGRRWGSGARVAWRPTEGAWHGAICGTWSNGYNYGGFWQEVPAVPGETHAFGAWYWADSTWSAGEKYMKIEFLDGADGGSNILFAATNTLGGIGESWSYKEVSAAAPTNATWVRVVIMASFIDYNGALQFDDLTLELTNQLAAPVSLPATGVTGNAFTANWQSVSGAAGYRLDVATNAYFVPGSFVSGYHDRSCTGLSQAVTGLVAGTSYHYRVQATNATGSSVHSGAVEVQTPSMFSVVALAGPNGTITPSGTVMAAMTASLDFSVQADTFYHIDSISSDGVPLSITNGTNMTVMWGPAADTGLVSAVFAEDQTTNGTPYWWLDAYYPGQTNFDDLALADGDDDGYPAWQEHVADTDPTDSNDWLQIDFAPQASEASLYFDSSSNRLYTLKACHDLETAAWSNVPGAGPRLGAGGPDSLQDTNIPAAGWYYLLKVELP